MARTTLVTSFGTSLIMLINLMGCNGMSDANSGGIKAVYKTFSLEGYRSFSKFRAVPKTGEVVPVYVEVLDGQRYRLNELPEDVVAQILKKVRPVTPPANGSINYSDNISILNYLDGKLQRVELDGTGNKFRISARKEGPYLTLNIDRETLLNEFGEPEKWIQLDPPKRPFMP